MTHRDGAIRLSFDGTQWLFCTETVGDLTQHSVYENGDQIIVEVTSQPFHEWAIENIEATIQMRRMDEASE